MRNPEDDVALADGHAFMVADAPYKEHLKTAAEFRQVSGLVLASCVSLPVIWAVLTCSDT